MPRLQVFVFIALSGCCASAPKVEPPRPVPAWLKPEVRAAVVEHDGDPAEFVPDDARLFVRVEDGGGVFGSDTDEDPLAAEAWKAIQEAAPAGFWRTAAPNLGLTEKELLQALFAKDLTLVDQKIDGRRRLVVLSRVREDLLLQLPHAGGLVPWAEQPDLGTFRLYLGESEGRRYVLAIGRRLLAFSSEDGANHVRRLLSATFDGVPPLTQNEGYRDLFAQLPQERTGVMFTQSSRRDESHALVVLRDGPRYEARYVARAPDVKKYVEALEARDGVDFGPLPSDVVLAGSVNLVTNELPSEGVLDMLLFPHSFRERVLERIEPPMIFFLGRVPRTDIDPDPGFDVPVFGFALRLKDPEVAKDLDRVCSGIHFLVSMSRFNLAEGFFGVEDVEKKLDANGKPVEATAKTSAAVQKIEYRRADFGPILRATGRGSILEKLASLPNASGLTRVAFGRIGEFYVICTQEAFFHRWREAAAGRSPRLVGSKDFTQFEFQDRDGLILSALTRGKELSKLINEAIAFIDQTKKNDGETSDDETKDEEPDPAESKDEKEAERIQKPLRWLANGLEQSETFSMQLWHTEDGLIRGKLVVLR